MKTSTIVKQEVPKSIPFQLIVDQKDAKQLEKKNSFRINWLLYIPAVAVAFLLTLPPFKGLFVDSGWRWVHILGLSITLSYSLIPLCVWLAKQFRILDFPDDRKLHHDATPLLGGVAVFIGFASAVLVNGIFSLELFIILAAALLIFSVSLIDDCKEISAGFKLAVQLIGTAMVMSCGIYLRLLPETLGLAAALGNALLTVTWIIGITNAMNFFDGMDGLAAGLGAIIAFFLGIVAFQNGQPMLGWIAVAMLGSCLGFLPYNLRHKQNAAIFLGDAGSSAIGFILACLAVYGDWAEANPIVAFVSPVLIFWILVFDMVHISVERIATGKVRNFRQWIEYVGRDHLHHRLANALGGKKQSVLFIYLMGICLGSSAVVLRNAESIDALLLIIQAAIVVVLITVLERRGRQTNGSKKHNQSFI